MFYLTLYYDVRKHKIKISVCVKCEADPLKNPMTFMLSYVQIGQEHQTHTHCIAA